ncbi:MAG TPA: NADH-quinone oxidoreductase subunit NuoG [Nitrospiraceae bacterium]|jgi:formate dehydrogenase alpha subunit|nr:NADH-quinone oxidoreductase subunit NuoG [Nitrospiraceae bacterium]
MANTVEMVKLTIDGHTITVPKGTLVIEAARQAGIMIPHFCYHPKLKPDANCRMCLVEIEKMPKLQTSCSTPVAEGMVVRHGTPLVNEAHKSVLEFILANHPLDCPVCDQGGRCDLQDFSHEYTPTTSRFIEVKRVFQKEYFSPLIETEMNRCVQCMRCVRYCDEVMDVKALAPSGRGTMTEIKHFAEHQLDCEFCGGCVQICPVGAITSRLSMYEFRPWMTKRADTTCTYCGDGCSITIQTKENQLIEVNSSHGAGRNNGDLCPRGFFGYHVTTHPDRLKQPLVRRDGRLVPTTWEDALEYVANASIRLKMKHGAETFAGLIGSRCTNEDIYMFQKFMRLAIGTNRIDSSARYGHINGVQALRRVQGTHRWTITFEDIVAANAILLVGTNITETNPITGLKVKEAVKKRQATLITIEALEPAVGTISNIVNLAAHHVTARPDQFGQIVLALIKAVMEENLVDQELSQRARGYVQAIRQAVAALPWSTLETAIGTKQTALKEAARAFARAPRAVILVGQGVLRAPGAIGIATNLLDLLLLTGQHGRPGCGLGPLAEQNNDQGAIELGAVAEFIPGPAELDHAQACQALAGLWKEELPQTAGRTMMDMLEDARQSKTKAMFIVGENPAGSLPPSSRVSDALSHLELLVCQELFLTETASLAHVVLPACSYAEKEGSFTNTEGYVQPVRPAIDPVGESRPDWEILSGLSVLIGYPLEYGGAKEILKEIRTVIPGYGRFGPAPTPPRPDATAVERYVQGGYADDLGRRYALPSRDGQQADNGKKLQLVVGQTLFHSGKFSTKALGLLKVQPSGFLAMNPADAADRGITEGSAVKIANERGEARTIAKVLDRIPSGMVFFPEHFDQDVRSLLTVATDPTTQVPSWRQTWVDVRSD